jgi:hypothetical protein
MSCGWENVPFSRFSLGTTLLQPSESALSASQSRISTVPRPCATQPRRWNSASCARDDLARGAELGGELGMGGLEHESLSARSTIFCGQPDVHAAEGDVLDHGKRSVIRRE